MIDSSAGLFGLSEPVMRKGTRQKLSCRRARSRKDGKWFLEGSRSNTNVQQQSGSLGKTGKVPVTYAKGWTPS